MNVYSLGGLSIAAIFLFGLWKFLEWIWLNPTKIERFLREQGLRGNSYSLLYGDLKDMRSMVKEARSKPIGLSDDFSPRVIPHVIKAIKNYGKNCFWWNGPRPMILITDPELIREVLTKSYKYQKPRSNPLLRLLARGLVSYDTEKWAKHRRIINPAFHLEKLKLMLPAFELSCSQMLSKWEAMVPNEGSQEIDVFPYLQTLTSDVISRTAFGSSYEEGIKIFELQKEQAVHAMNAASSIYIPGWRFLPTERTKRMKQIDKEVRASIRNIINKRLNAMKVGEPAGDDLLSILLESNLREIEENKNKSSGMSIDDVIEECKLFYFAGQETTSVLLVWTMILLSGHQNWQDEARAEVLNLFGNEKPDFNKLNHLKIVTMILYEVLRLFPPILTLGRRNPEEVKLGQVTLPVGVQLSMPILVLHRDKKIWGDDANEFNPQRFSEGVSNATKGRTTFFPFGWGPRICIGQNFAMLEARMAMAMILQRFSFELSPSYKHSPGQVLILQPLNGAHLFLHKLQK